ncbi:hypothetical protein TUMSATVNIG1_44400 [Vibrio nigripulchritudo]|nr:hypothetical protein VNTUMSATTG_44070 [Vibrio nigripulchritudo]BDU33831.1 hypothetical protein TUMSATVNIG1_44400 [Vibrio nigripulchritudo]
MTLLCPSVGGLNALPNIAIFIIVVGLNRARFLNRNRCAIHSNQCLIMERLEYDKTELTLLHEKEK